MRKMKKDMEDDRRRRDVPPRVDATGNAASSQAAQPASEEPSSLDIDDFL